MKHFAARDHRLARLLIVALFTLGLFNWTGVPAGAQQASPLAAAQDQATETPAEAPRPTASVVSTESATAALSETPTSEPGGIQIAFTATPEPAETATPTATATTAAEVNGAAETLQTGVRLTIRRDDGSGTGPAVEGICATLTEQYYRIFSAGGCSDANGMVELQVAFPFNGAKMFYVEINPPDGYLPFESFLITLSMGEVRELTGFIVPVADGAETLKAIEGGAGLPFGGACWTYYDNYFNTPREIKIGPICDTDNDGTVTVSPIPYAAYCLTLTVPNGYDIVGPATTCAPASRRTGTITKSVVNFAQGTSGAARVTAKTSWGAPLTGACVRVLGQGGYEAGYGCTGADGTVRIGGLMAGSFTLAPGVMPDNFTNFDAVGLSVALGKETPVSVVIPWASSGDLKMTAFFAYDPNLALPGACWSYNLNDNGAPSATVVIGPVCDTDGDGLTTIAGVPRGAFCIVLVSPPPGYVRPNGTGGSYCDPNMHGGQGRLGFAAAPSPTSTPSPTPTKTGTPRPTATPTRTPTPIPTPPPAGDEPKGGLTVKNCFQKYTDQFYGGSYYTVCASAPAGIKFAIVQNGVVVGQVTTTADGVGVINIDQRVPFVLRYLSGAGSQWTPGPNETTQFRYSAQTIFYFEPPADVDRSWTMTVRVKGLEDSNTPIGGACFKIVDKNGQTLLPEACDTDNDGTVVVGTLPPRFDNYGSPVYTAVMTQGPTGYPIIDGYGFGSASDPDHPHDWSSTFYYSTHVLRVISKDPDGNIVPSMCYSSLPEPLPGGVSYRETECDYQGVAKFTNQTAGAARKITVETTAAGYVADQSTFIVTIDSGYYTDLIVTVRKYGTEGPTMASVRLKAFVNLYYTGDLALVNDISSSNLKTLCLSLTPNTGTPSGSNCLDPRKGEMVFRDLAAGTYAINLAANQSTCALANPSNSFTIGQGDLGREVQVKLMLSCGNVFGCADITTATGRSVDIYYGTLKDADGKVITTSVQVSESAPSAFMEELLKGAIPNPALINTASLAPWTNAPSADLGGGSSWYSQPDWDGNARQSLLTAFTGYGTISPAARLDRGNVIVSAGGYVDFEFVDPADYAKYPGCWEVVHTGYYQSTVHFYELNATLTKSSKTTPTPYPSPEPVCFTGASRDLTAYYGTLKDQNGGTILSVLALSDHIPTALRDAIKNGDAPTGVKSAIGNWVGGDLADADWPFGSPESLDPSSGLIQQYASSASNVVPGSPDDQGATSYEYTTYRYYDETALPSGCVAPAEAVGRVSASFARLIPVLQTTTVNVHYVELNAVGEAAATATPTVTPTNTPTPTATATKTGKPGKSPTPTATATPGISALPDAGVGFGGGSFNPAGMWALVALATAVLVSMGLRRRSVRSQANR